MDTDAGWNGFAILLYATAIIGFVSAGLGILGARPFRSTPAVSAGAATLASIIAFALLGDRDVWPGIAWTSSWSPERFGWRARQRRRTAHVGSPLSVTWLP